ncbi:MAG: hypothetical protein GY940_06990 [bacterium]|nr:hypothetical protein [bacterium]
MRPERSLTLFIYFSIFCCFFLLSGGGFASERGTAKLPIDSQLGELLTRTFYEKGVVSGEKVETFRLLMDERYKQIKSNLKRVYRRKDGLSSKAAEQKTNRQGNIKAYRILLDYIEDMEDSRGRGDTEGFNALAVKALELEDALKVAGAKLFTTKLFEKIPASLKKRKIPLRAAPYGEASNLVDGETGLFFKQGQLIKMKAGGVDLSKLNPPGDSSYWRSHDISAIDVKSHYQSGGDGLNKGLGIVFPGTTGKYKKMRYTQTKPKMDITMRDGVSGRKLDFKLKIGGEMHSDPTASALFAALGFSVDHTQYVRDFKLELGKTTPFEFKRQWNAYFSRYDVNSYIKKEGEDGKGHYIIFHEGLLEAKRDELLRVGPWGFDKNGHGSLREVRGAILFNMWVANIDLKEADNNKLVLRKIKGQYEFFHIQHDLGFAFGGTYSERPGEFPWQLVKKKTGEDILLSYRCFWKNSAIDRITYADARWMTRLLAELSRDQIEAAVELGGWPGSMGQLLVEKLIHRRNQLVKALGLEGEEPGKGKRITILPCDRYLTTGDGVVVKGKLKVFRVPGYVQFFGPRIREVIPQMLGFVRNLVVDGLVDGISAIRYIRINPEHFGGTDDFIGRIRLGMDREIEENPWPTGENDQFLVRDTLQLGLRPRYGQYLTADLSYSRKYTVVYPVRTRDEGRFHNNFIINLGLWNQVKKFGVDRRFAAVVEDFYEIRGKLKTSKGHTPLLAASAAVSRVYVNRYFISRRLPNHLVYFEDKSRYNQLAYKVFLQFAYLFNFRVPFFKRTIQKGKIDREYIDVDISERGKDADILKAVKRLLLKNDSSEIKRLGTPRSIRDKFFEKKTKFNLLGFYKIRSIYRVDRLREVSGSVYGGKNPKSESPLLEKGREHFQVESLRKRTWRFLDNGEVHASWVRMTGKSEKTGKKGIIKQPRLVISMGINDKNATDGELKEGYLGFINGVVGDGDFIRFDPAVHTRNGHWGSLQVHLDIVMYGKAIGRLINLKGEELWGALSSVTGESVVELKRSAGPRYERGRPVYRYGSANGSSYLAAKAGYLIRAMKRARGARGSLGQMRALVKGVRKAIYTSGHSFEYRLLAALHKIVGKKNLYIEAGVTFPIHKENIFPERQPLFNRRGELRKMDPLLFEYIFDDPAEIYHIF